ncbi:MAG TPA: MoxR family ATPase [Candidatus Limnocylindrales bacterium]|nr:MoxR family ATPase [Candidatus Limnocylindrales bacterium]
MDPTSPAPARRAAIPAAPNAAALDPGPDGSGLPMERVLYEVKKVIVGQDHLLERMVVALLARGHLLVEGVPGLAKTMSIKTLAGVFGGDFKRIQFTPDLVPADLVGTRVFNQKTGEFSTALGPVFTNLLLADEINRAPAKVQSALLEVMQERQVTIGRETWPVPDPFLVLATQNPIETEGTYPLPEAQVDRFMLKVVVGYPSQAEEFVITQRMTSPLAAPGAVLSPAGLLALQARADEVYVDPALHDYAVRLARATRRPSEVGASDVERYVTFGASPRASINLILTARALAFVRGRDYALPQDVIDMALDVMRHRIVLSYEALADDVTSDQVLKAILSRVPVPVVPLREHADLARDRHANAAPGA